MVVEIAVMFPQMLASFNIEQSLFCYAFPFIMSQQLLGAAATFADVIAIATEVSKAADEAVAQAGLAFVAASTALRCAREAAASLKLLLEQIRTSAAALSEAPPPPPPVEVTAAAPLAAQETIASPTPAKTVVWSPESATVSPPAPVAAAVAAPAARSPPPVEATAPLAADSGRLGTT